MIEELGLAYNRARQGSITQELTEIIAGANAISNNKGETRWQNKILVRSPQIIGAVLDIKFSQGGLPSINDAIDIMMKNGNRLVVRE